MDDIMSRVARIEGYLISVEAILRRLEIQIAKIEVRVEERTFFVPCVLEKGLEKKS